MLISSLCPYVALRPRSQQSERLSIETLTQIILLNNCAKKTFREPESPASGLA